MLVAVRAIAPVAGIPPNSPDAMFAIPCPTSSTFDLWRVPIIPSATTAESSDSIAASSATVTADGKSSRMRSAERAGKCGDGIPAWISPNREPIVSTGRRRSAAPTVARRIATIGPGIRRDTLGQKIRTASAKPDTARAAGDALRAWSAKACHFSRKPVGTGPIRRPSRSLICDEKMMTAIPLVNPVTTG